MAKKIKLEKITHPDFAWAISQIVNASIPAKAAYWLAKIFRKIESHQKAFDVVRIKTLQKYVKTSIAPDGTIVIDRKEVPDKNNVLVPGQEPFWNDADCEKKFTAELDELLAEEVEVPTMKFSLFGDDTKIETRLLLLLEDVIEVE